MNLNFLVESIVSYVGYFRKKEAEFYDGNLEMTCQQKNNYFK